MSLEVPANRTVSLDSLEAYGPALQARVRELIAEDRLGEYLRNRYPQAHDVRTDKALF